MIFTEQEISRLGLMLNPSNPDQLVRIDEFPLPSDDWSPEALATYAKLGLDVVRRLQRDAVLLSRTSAVTYYYVGKSLDLAQRKLPRPAPGRRSGWRRWLKEQGIAKTTAYRAINVYRNSGDVSKVDGITLTEALRRYGGSSRKDGTPGVAGHPDESCDGKQILKRVRSSQDRRNAYGGNGTKVPTSNKRQEIQPKEAFVRRLEEKFGDKLAKEPLQVSVVAARLLSLLSEQEEREAIEILELAVREYWLQHGDSSMTVGGWRTEARH